ncbi:MAG TPA: hypothetical protein VJ742_12455 [Nitrososphaera sp.]|nr:hypothetical protein [Nitrososphaera sp.]
MSKHKVVKKKTPWAKVHEWTLPAPIYFPVDKMKINHLSITVGKGYPIVVIDDGPAVLAKSVTIHQDDNMYEDLKVNGI